MVAEEIVFRNYQQNPFSKFSYSFISSFVTNFFSLNITLIKHIHTLILNVAIMNYIIYFLSYSRNNALEFLPWTS